MKICLVTEFFYPDRGSTPKLLSELMGHLKDQHADLEIDVVTSNNLYKLNETLAPFEDWNGIKITRLATPASNRFPAPLRLAAGFLFSRKASREMLKRSDYDLILVGTNPPSSPLAARRYQRLRKRPYVYLIHDLYPDIAIAVNAVSANGLLGRLARRMQKQWLHGAARVIVLGRCMRDHLNHKYDLPLHNIEVVPNWADPDELPVLDRATEFRKKNELDGKFVVLYSGNLGYSHGIKDIVDAAALLESKRDDVAFVLVGNGAQKDQIADYVREIGAESVRLLPPVDYDAYPDLLASADASLVSLGEGTHGLAVPCKFYSYLASGRAIVGILDRDSEVARTLQEADCGVQVNPGDPAGLAKAIARLADSREAVERMGRNAREALVSRFRLSHAADHYYRVFESVLDERRGERARV